MKDVVKNLIMNLEQKSQSQQKEANHLANNIELFEHSVKLEFAESDAIF